MCVNPGAAGGCSRREVGVVQARPGLERALESARFQNFNPEEEGLAFNLNLVSELAPLQRAMAKGEVRRCKLTSA